MKRTAEGEAVVNRRAAVLRALRLDEGTHIAALAHSRRPAGEALTRIASVLDRNQCAALRALIDANASSGRDTIDGKPDRQVNLAAADVERLLGVDARERLW